MSGWVLKTRSLAPQKLAPLRLFKPRPVGSRTYVLSTQTTSLLVFIDSVGLTAQALFDTQAFCTWYRPYVAADGGLCFASLTAGWHDEDVRCKSCCFLCVSQVSVSTSKAACLLQALGDRMMRRHIHLFIFPMMHML